MKNTKDLVIKRGSTLFLYAAMFGTASMVVLLAALFVPAIYREFPKELPHLASWRYLFIFAIIASSIVFFVALGHIIKLLNIIDQNKAFTKASVRAMENVKRCGMLISGLFAMCMPLIFFLAQADDAPGLILFFGFVFVGVPLMITVFAGVAQQLFQSAIDIKSENDLTV